MLSWIGELGPGECDWIGRCACSSMMWDDTRGVVGGASDGDRTSSSHIDLKEQIMLANEAIWNFANQLENRLSKSDCCTVEFWTCCLPGNILISIIASSSSTPADLTMADPGELRERKRSDFIPSLAQQQQLRPPEQSTCTTLIDAPHVEDSASRTARPS